MYVCVHAHTGAGAHGGPKRTIYLTGVYRQCEFWESNRGSLQNWGMS